MVTITTVGYGDMGPVTQAGRIFTSFFVLGGVGIIGVALGIVGSYVLEQQQRLQKELLKRAQALALDNTDTESSDSDTEGGVKIAKMKTAQLLKGVDKTPVGCLVRFGKRWLKVFLPVIFTLSMGLIVLSVTEPMDPQLEEVLLVHNETHNETRYILTGIDGESSQRDRQLQDDVRQRHVLWTCNWYHRRIRRHISFER